MRPIKHWVETTKRCGKVDEIKYNAMWQVFEKKAIEKLLPKYPNWNEGIHYIIYTGQ